MIQIKVDPLPLPSMGTMTTAFITSASAAHTGDAGMARNTAHPNEMKPFTLPSALPGWAMHATNNEPVYRRHVMATALATYEQRRQQVLGAVAGSQDAQAETLVEALAKAAACAATLLAEMGEPDLAAGVQGELHRTLMDLIRQGSADSLWRKAAQWHCQCSHAALMTHVSEHGWSEEIEFAVRAGCLTMRPPVGMPH